MNPVLEVVLRSVSVLAVFLVLPLIVGQTEHKVMAHMQGRLGPMYAGGFHGWAQLVADAAKFIQKEDITPRAADRWVFKLAPAIALVPYLVALAVIPISPTLVGADVDAGVLFVLAASAVGILGLLMAGWSSANKYALLGGMRAAAQLLSYELPLVLSVASVALAAGTLSLTGIADAWHPLWLLWQLPGAMVFLVAAVAELQRSPFDMPIADSEIVMGPFTEYSGLRFRVLPALRVCRHRRDVPAVHRAVPRRVARSVLRLPRAGVDAVQERVHLGGDHLAACRLAAPS